MQIRNKGDLPPKGLHQILGAFYFLPEPNLKLIVALISGMIASSCWGQLQDDLRGLKGVAVYSQGDLGSDLAAAVTYSHFEHFQQTFTIKTPTRTVRVLRKELYENIPIRSFSGTVQSAEDRTQLELDIKTLEAAAEKYLSSSGFLKRISIELSKLKERYDQGEVYVNHQWLIGKPAPSTTSTTFQSPPGMRVEGSLTLSGPDGREFLNPEFLRLEDDVVHFRHSGGFSSVASDSLPALFKDIWSDKLKSPAEKPKMSNVEARIPQVSRASFDWVPTSIDEAAECVVLIEGDAGSGSGFLCFDDGFFFIYTNAHVLAGNRQLKITSVNGQSFSNFRFIETAPDGYDNGDLVRLALSEAPDKALRLAASDKIPKIEDAIWALGNGQGSGVVRPLEGKLVSIGPTRLEISSNIVKGDSGGPLLNADFNVLGVSSFGNYRVDVWLSNTELNRRFALRPGAVRSWDKFDSVDFLRVAYVYDQMLADVVLTEVVKKMSFSVSDGITYNKNEEIMAGLDANELVNAFESHDFAARLLRFNKDEYSFQGGGVEEQIRDILLAYANLFSAGHTGMVARKRYVESQIKIPYFLRLKFNEILKLHYSASEEILKRALEINKALGGR
jgi:S1-C subfamily serine protease